MCGSGPGQVFLAGFFTLGGSEPTWTRAFSTHWAARSGPSPMGAGGSPHRALGQPNGPAPSTADSTAASGSASRTPTGPEQPGEHVAVHERAEVAEHRLHLDLRVPGRIDLKNALLVLARLGHPHG